LKEKNRILEKGLDILCNIDKNFRGLNMGYIQIYYKIAAQRAIKGLERAQVQSEISQETKYRKRVIEHYERFGLSSTLDAYKISRATLYNWQKKYIGTLGYMV
jgi:hypothetical protein